MSSVYRTLEPLRFDRATWWVLGLSAALFVGFSLYTTALYRSFELTGADFGSYVHMFATTLRGEGFLLQGKYRPGHPGGSYWGAHFSVTLLLFLPVYALAPSPVTLLVAKAFVLAASIPAFWFVARHHVDSDYLAGLLVVSYAFNPFLWSAWVFDFQEQALLPVLVFGAYHCYRTERHRGFLLAFALALLTNEFAVIVLAGALVGLAVAAARRGRLAERRAVLLAAGTLIVVVWLVADAVVAQFSVASGIPLASIADPFHPFVGGTRATIGDLLGVLVAHPDVALRAVGDESFRKAAFFVLLLVPVVFLPVTDEVTVGALAPYLAFAWLFAGRSAYYLFGAHYPLYLLPAVYVGTARVADDFAVTPSQRTLLARLFVTVLVLSVGGSVAAGVEYGAVPDADAHDETVRAAIEGIPTDASLVTQNDVYPHVATRPNARFVVRPSMFERYERRYGPIAPEYVLVDAHPAGAVDWSRAVVRSFGDRLGEEYGLYRYEDGVRVYKRGYAGPTRAITDDRVVPPGAIPPLTATGERAGTVRPPLDIDRHWIGNRSARRIASVGPVRTASVDPARTAPADPVRVASNDPARTAPARERAAAHRSPMNRLLPVTRPTNAPLPIVHP